MNALVSGQAGLAVVIEGDSAKLVRAAVPLDAAKHPDDASDGIEIPTSAIWLLFASATDVFELVANSWKDVRDALRRAYDADRVVHLALILIDSEQDADDRSLASEFLQQMITDAERRDHLFNILYSAPLPSQSDIEGTIKYIAKDDSQLTALLRSVANDQPSIRRVRETLDNIAEEHFGGLAAKVEFIHSIRKSPVSRILASHPGAIPGAVQMRVYEQLKGLPRAIAIAREWMRGLGVVRSERAEILSEEAEYEDDRNLNPHVRHERRKLGLKPHEIKENVDLQKKAIKHAIAEGDVSLARKFTQELIESQTAPGQDPRYASMSLCDLSQHAKLFDNYSLQLELAEWATKVCPEDGRAHGQTADAYIGLGYLDDARRSLDLAAEFGERAYAATGYARLLRLQGRLHESLQRMIAARSEFPQELQPWLGVAELLRELWRLEEAKSAYDEAVSRFPYNSIAISGRATVLKELGQFDKALVEYDIASQLAPDDPHGVDGKADALFRMGKLDEALALYQETMHRLPGDSVAWCGAAEVLLAKGRGNEAIGLYEAARSKFPYVSVPSGGLANAFLVLGRHSEAEEAYSRALSAFPRDSVTRNGFANFLRRSGRLVEALAAYDSICQQFPYDYVARSARAELLKQLRRLDDAVSAYRELVGRRPQDDRLRVTLAAVLSAKGEFREAERLLPQALRTQTDWIGHHVRGMILLRRGRFAAAERIFQEGVERCPWHNEVKYFRRALAVCRIRKRQPSEAADLVAGDNDPLAWLLSVHALGEMGWRHAASKVYQRLRSECPPLLIPLRDELGDRYIFGNRGQKSQAWVFEEEESVMLLRAA
jgi:tetratricopeptide (TPR) repeat protein